MREGGGGQIDGLELSIEWKLIYLAVSVHISSEKDSEKQSLQVA